MTRYRVQRDGPQGALGEVSAFVLEERSVSTLRHRVLHSPTGVEFGRAARWGGREAVRRILAQQRKRRARRAAWHTAQAQVEQQERALTRFVLGFLLCAEVYFVARIGAGGQAAACLFLAAQLFVALGLGAAWLMARRR